MKELQLRIGNWQQRTFGESGRALATAKHLREEADELIQSIKSSECGRISGDFNRISNEIADVFILLAGVAHRVGVDIEDAVEAKMSENMRRTWKAPDAEGIIRHQEEP